MGNASLFPIFVTINLAIEMEMKWGKINLSRAHLLKTNDEHTKNTRETIWKDYNSLYDLFKFDFCNSKKKKQIHIPGRNK